MKRVTASDARKNWFRLLDEVVDGEVVVIDRGGRRILIQRETSARTHPEAIDYRPILAVPNVEEADQWGWEWPGPESELVPIPGGTQPDGGGDGE